NKNITFGGKALLRKITKAKQSGNLELFNKYHKEYTKKRKLGVYLVGRACEGGNRKVDFDFQNKSFIFKPNRKTNIKIDFKASGKLFKTLLRLQNLINDNSIPITVRLSKKHVFITYDELILSGYKFNNKECQKEQKCCKDKE